MYISVRYTYYVESLLLRWITVLFLRDEMDFVNKIKDLQDITLYYYTFLILKKKKMKTLEVHLLIWIGVNVMVGSER